MKRLSPLLLIAAAAAVVVALLARNEESPLPPESWSPVEPK